MNRLRPLRRALRPANPLCPSAESAVVISSVARPVALGVAACLRRHGGVPIRSRPGRYEFASLAARDRAIADARQRHGWTCVELDDARRPVLGR